MRVNLVRIGNSQGIRIPKPLLDQCAFGAEAELVVREGSLVITPVSPVRAGWDQAFGSVASRDDEILLDGATSAFDGEEWEW